MSAARRLIVNADDFGQGPGVNRGIIRAFEEGIVTSASLMVRWPAAAAAADYARRHPRLSVGLHLDLGQWTTRGGTRVPLYLVVPPDDPQAVASELHRQLQTFRRLLGRDPTHFDSHQHLHFGEPTRSLLLVVGSRLGVPVRALSPQTRFFGEFYGRDPDGSRPERIAADNLIAILAQLPEGTTELMCHPGEANDVPGTYQQERVMELATLCDPDVRAALHRECIERISFHDLVPRGRPE
jgi:chitin disaccharide deacetylase